MPLKGFLCPKDAPTAGAKNDFEHCVRACPHQCQPDFILNKIAKRESGNEHKGDMLSPTALNGCARKLKLTRTEDYWDTPQSLFDATRGGLVHGFLEDCDLPGVVQEKRIYKTVTVGPNAPWLISGRVDYYDRLKRRISDIKTMSDKGLYVVFGTGAKAEHIWQLNLYRWLLWGGHVDAPNGPQVFWPVHELQLVYLFMNRAIATGRVYVDTIVEWSKKDLNWGKPWGCETSRRSLGPSPKGKPTWEVTFNIPPVPIYTFDKVEDYLAKEGPTRVKAFRDPNYMPAGVIGDKKKEWECGFCPVRQRCLQIEEADSVVRGLKAQADSDATSNTAK